MLVIDRQERSLECREYRQLVVGPFNRRQGHPNGLDLLPTMKRLAANEEVGDSPSFDRVGVWAGDVLTEADEPPEEHGDVTGLHLHAHVGTVGLTLGHAPVAPFVEEPRDEGTDGVRQRLVDGLAGGLEGASRVR